MKTFSDLIEQPMLNPVSKSHVCLVEKLNFLKASCAKQTGRDGTASETEKKLRVHAIVKVVSSIPQVKLGVKFYFNGIRNSIL